MVMTFHNCITAKFIVVYMYVILREINHFNIFKQIAIVILGCKIIKLVRKVCIQLHLSYDKLDFPAHKNYNFNLFVI